MKDKEYEAAVQIARERKKEVEREGYQHGSSFEEWLEEEGIKDEVQALARKPKGDDLCWEDVPGSGAEPYGPYCCMRRAGHKPPHIALKADALEADAK